MIDTVEVCKAVKLVQCRRDGRLTGLYITDVNENLSSGDKSNNPPGGSDSMCPNEVWGSGLLICKYCAWKTSKPRSMVTLNLARHVTAIFATPNSRIAYGTGVGEAEGRPLSICAARSARKSSNLVCWFELKLQWRDAVAIRVRFWYPRILMQSWIEALSDIFCGLA